MARASPRAASRTWRLGLAMLALLPLHREAALAASPSPRKLDDLCRPAAMAAEIDAQLPQGLLLAIAHVESGRRDPASGSAIPWPWTINAEGVPMVFETREEAVAAVVELRARNVRLIDVGCMQVNLYHHPDAFRSLAEAFDPATNARYAARFLSRLRDSSGDWDTAIGRYHSSTPGLSEGYRTRVLAAWSRPGRASPLDLRREQVASAWASARAGGNGPPPAATLGGRTRNPREATLGQMAALWQRTRQDGTAMEPVAEPPPPAARLARAPLLAARGAPPRDLLISAR